MFKNTTYEKIAFRFRRWSRKRYAAFNSIGRCVNIGTLQSSVCECTLRKQHFCSLKTDSNQLAKDPETSQDDAPPEPSAIVALQLQLAAIPFFKSDYANAYLNTFTTLQESRRECHMAHSPAFLYLIPTEDDNRRT